MSEAPLYGQCHNLALIDGLSCVPSLLDGETPVHLQGYLTYKKTHPPRTLPEAYV